MSRKWLILLSVFVFSAGLALSKNIADVYPELDIKNDDIKKLVDKYLQCM